MPIDGYASLLRLQCKLAGLPLPETELRFAPPRRWRFDCAWPAYNIAAEVDGGIYARGRHARGPGIEADMEKQNAAVLAGWRVLRFSTGMVKSGEAVKVLTQALR